jgi:RNA recognition motif-containing protein
MKLTKLHIFIIILLVLILCPTLGACSVQEGYENRYPDTSASASSSTGTSDSSGQQYSRQFSNYSKFDHALDKTTMNNNPVYVSSYNTGYSAPKNTSSQMSGAGNTATSSGSGSSKGLLAWLKSLF